MKKIVSLLLVFSMIFTFALNTLAQTEIDKIDTPSGLSTETINQLVDEYVTVNSDGLLDFNIQQARRESNHNSTLIIMQDIIDDVNVSLNNGDLIMGNIDSDDAVGVKNWGIGPWSESTRKTFCLIKNDAKALSDAIQANGAAALKAFLLNGLIATIGLSSMFSLPMYIAGQTLGVATFLGNNTSPIVTEIESKIRDMNDNQYLVMNISIQNEWRTLGDWRNEQPPNKVYFLRVVGSWISNYEVKGGDLLDYL